MGHSFIHVTFKTAEDQLYLRHRAGIPGIRNLEDSVNPVPKEPLICHGGQEADGPEPAVWWEEIPPLGGWAQHGTKNGRAAEPGNSFQHSWVFFRPTDRWPTITKHSSCASGRGSTHETLCPSTITGHWTQYPSFQASQMPTVLCKEGADQPRDSEGAEGR